jgi:hypothetical protein
MKRNYKNARLVHVYSYIQHLYLYVDSICLRGQSWLFNFLPVMLFIIIVLSPLYLMFLHLIYIYSTKGSLYKFACFFNLLYRLNGTVLQ